MLLRLITSLFKGFERTFKGSELKFKAYEHNFQHGKDCGLELIGSHGRIQLQLCFLTEDTVEI